MICTRCNRDHEDHTLRELRNGVCTQPTTQPTMQAAATHAWTATEMHRVNPEAIENTGEVFALGKYTRAVQGTVVPSLQNMADMYERLTPHL